MCIAGSNSVTASPSLVVTEGIHPGSYHIHACVSVVAV